MASNHLIPCRAADGLEEWRKEAKELQRQQEMKVLIEGRVKHPQAAEMAPFATDVDNHTSQQKLSPAQTRLKVGGEQQHLKQFLNIIDFIQELEGQREALARQQRQQGGDTTSSTSRESREVEVENKVHQYMIELAEKRKQAGIISSPSTELLEAERRLAEVKWFTITLFA